MHTWFTSDTHYGHANIIKYCNRPFADVEAMNAQMIWNWNETVSPEDTVYHLGDFAFGTVEKIRSIRERLVGRIVLIRGNHDRSEKEMLKAGFDEVHTTLGREIDGKLLYLAHIPPIGEPKPGERQYKKEFTPKPPAYYDLWVCGHVHDHWLRKGKVVNAGVDQWKFTPVRLQNLMESK